MDKGGMERGETEIGGRDNRDREKGWIERNGGREERQRAERWREGR